MASMASVLDRGLERQEKSCRCIWSRRREAGVCIDKGVVGTEDSVKVTTVIWPEKKRNILLVIFFLLWKVKETIFNADWDSSLSSPSPKNWSLGGVPWVSRASWWQLSQCFPTVFSLKHTRSKFYHVYSPNHRSLRRHSPLLFIPQ